MSKLIVEMEMPVCCADCPCCICLNGMKPAYCKAVMVDDDNIVDGLMWRETDPNNRPSWCPICGVLPDEHGDLVDKETAKNAFDSSFLTFRMKDGETMRGFYQRTIDELPVLIAAERKDDADN